MPLARRKKVVLNHDDPAIQEAADKDPSRQVFYLPQTGEIFFDYQTYAARLTFYKLHVFQCEVTGKGGLNFFEALESEKNEAKTLHARFPEQLKAAVLRSVHWQIVGRIDHLVEYVYERFKDRYFEGERVFVDVQGDKYWATISKVFPPKTQMNGSSPSPDDDTDKPVHQIDGDLKLPVEEVNKKDDPKGYFYKVQLIEENSAAAQGQGPVSGGKGLKWGGSLMEVRCSAMSRDRLAFSKSILRRFIRDCVDRDSSIASPWTVKPTIAEKYGLPSEMPAEIRKSLEQAKKGEIEKRKKVWDEKDGPAPKKTKRMTADERAKLALEEERARIKAEEEEKERAAAEAAAAALEAKKKAARKVLKYPIEDLDLPYNPNTAQTKPAASRELPFEVPAVFESFLMSWNFLVTFSKPLNLSPFTLDEFEHAIRHAIPEIPCPLIAEAHTSLIMISRSLQNWKHSAVMSLVEEKEKRMDEDGVISIDMLTDALAEVGSNWERVPLRASEGREGWEDALVGCLKDHATVATFPRLREVLTNLLFAPEDVEASSSPSSERSSQPLSKQSSPAERYYLLPYADKIAIFAFLCELVVNAPGIHRYLEACELGLTNLRKEKAECNKGRRAIAEELAAIEQPTEKQENGDGNAGDTTIDTLMESGDDDEEKGSDAGSSTGGGRGGSSRQRALRLKLQTQKLAKQREEARAKTQAAKKAAAALKDIEDRQYQIDARLEEIEFEFRQLLGVSRSKAIGMDRFRNRYYWFDGQGGGSLVTPNGNVLYGAGRIFVQGPAPHDLEVMKDREPKLEEMRKRVEGEGMVLGEGEWAIYDDIDQAEALLAWLNTKGVREHALKHALNKWWDHIAPGMRKRAADVATPAKPVEARRSSRTRKNAPDVKREPYMQWKNRQATNSQSS